jgi:hypothetical protein
MTEQARDQHPGDDPPFFLAIVADANSADGQDNRNPDDGAAEERARRFELIRFGDMRPRLDGRPLVKGLLDREQTGIFIGESGCGKTFLALDGALHVAAGLPWFGRKVSQGAVVYVAAEAGRSIENRVIAWRDAHDLDGKDIAFAIITSPLDLCHAERRDADALIAAIRGAGIKPVLLVIDTVSRALAGGDENSSADMGALVRSLDHLRDELGAHVLGVHHLGKDTGKGARGHSLLRSAVDTEIRVERNDANGIATATVTKQRDGIAGEGLAFKLRQVELGSDQDGDPVTSCVVEPVDEIAPATNRAKPLTGQTGLALRQLENALANAGVQPPSTTHFPAGRPVVPVSLWREYCREGGLVDGGDTGNFKKAFLRARNRLQDASRIGIWNDQVWLVAPKGDKGT